MSVTDWLIPDITTSQDLSAAGGTALDFTTSVGRPFKLDSIHFHFSVAVTETITIKRNSAKGANYSTVLKTIPLVAQQDYVFRPDGDPTFQKGDEIDIDITAANATGVAYVVAKARELLH